MSYFYNLFLISITLLSTGNLLSQNKGDSFIKQASFYHENDAFFAPKNTDDNYTAGLRLDVVTKELKFWQPFFKLTGKNPKYYNHFNFGFQSFTPTNISNSEVITSDRPYASYTFLSLGRTQLFKNTVFYSELSIGALGLPLAKRAQIYIHKKKFLGTDRPRPMGWDNQIENGGSLAINYKVNYLYVFNDAISHNYVIPSIRVMGNFGNYISDLYVGTQLSLLNINYSNSSLNFNEKVGYHHKRNGKTRFNIFVEPGFRWNIYNPTLQGALFLDNSVYTVDRSKINSFLFDVNLGMNLIIKDVLVLKYTLTRRTQEFSFGKQSHWWGGFGLGIKL
ncbi:hypothetical protein FHR24_002470 [Wenyingzhuangia heitensis]|uniref:Lipid A deacylase LpxR family protein n=1 Tax=Wenyingzhuangia heitensis TaxID=1487859 RepID=A0ABX0UG53_9FLAO|nr:lipid A-modifier LpxR family protein [Wenyingzhuangia heitensis]NIJ45992.1 hypothetical protein [Wenyingzhuangia heitensis]